MNIRNFLHKVPVDLNNLDKIILYSISLMMGVMFFDHTNALATICLFTATAAWIYKWILERRILFEWDLLGIILLLLLINAFFSSIASYDVKYSFREFRGEIFKMVLFYFLILSNIKTPYAFKTIMKAVFTGALVMSIIGVVGYFTGFTLYRGRTISLFANKSYTSLGFYLLMTSCLVLGLIIYEKNRKKVLAFFLLLIVYFSCIMVTLTRSIWLGFFSASLITLFLYRKKLILLFPLMILIFFLLFPSNFTSRFMSILDFQNYAKAGGVLSDRVQLWQSAIKMIEDYPVLGVGYGKRIFKKVYIKEKYILPHAKERRALPNAHNLYLDTGVQLGIPGIILFLFLIGVFFKRTIATYKNTTDYSFKGVILGCLLGIYEFLQIGLTGNLFYDENGLYIIFMMATAMTYYRWPQGKCIRPGEP
jgi:O-antigen ligase